MMVSGVMVAFAPNASVFMTGRALIGVVIGGAGLLPPASRANSRAKAATRQVVEPHVDRPARRHDKMVRNGWPHWYRTVDVRLGKAFAVRGGRLVATADVFNLANWANHSDYQNNQSLVGFGDPVADYARRQAQFGLRYEF